MNTAQYTAHWGDGTHILPEKISQNKALTEVFAGENSTVAYPQQSRFSTCGGQFQSVGR
jgi:hypothetical protein